MREVIAIVAYAPTPGCEEKLLEIVRGDRSGAQNPPVLAMWDKFFAVCDCVPLKTVPEAESMLAGFEPIEE